MKGRKKIIYIFFLMLAVTIISVAGGLLALYFGTSGRVPVKVFAGSVDIGGLTRQEAVKKVKENYDSFLKDNFLTINYSTGNFKNEFKIKYSDIDAEVNADSTVDKIYGKKGGELFKALIESYFISKNRIITPDILFNKGKLAERLEELSAIIYKEPKNANIYLIDGKITKEPEENGLKLDVNNAVKKVGDEIGTHFNKPLEFKTENQFELSVQEPEFTLENLKDAEAVISSYTTEIKSFELENSIRLAANAINKVWVLGKSEKSADPGEFSFNKCLSSENGIVEQNNEGYNQVASTLNAALMLAGVDSSSIARTPHKVPADYIEPGLDAVVFGNTIDFKFKNTLDGVIVIFASVRDNKLTVSLVGKKKDQSVKTSLKVEVEQKLAPSVINIEDQGLPPGQKKVIYGGREGVKVNVYVVTSKEGKEIERKFLYNDKYNAQDIIVQIGTNAKRENKDMGIK